MCSGVCRLSDLPTGEHRLLLTFERRQRVLKARIDPQRCIHLRDGQHAQDVGRRYNHPQLGVVRGGLLVSQHQHANT